jgi:hypothetical protein
MMSLDEELKQSKYARWITEATMSKINKLSKEYPHFFGQPNGKYAE